jgi:hypothetical protein
MRELRLDDFAGNVGQTYNIVFSDGVLPLVLEQAQPLPAGQREAGAFRLQFLGPPEPVIVQGTYPFRLGEETDEIFIVPIGKGEDGVQYEAIFI